jgi:tetratricopeptide (TPR) repeat protein
MRDLAEIRKRLNENPKDAWALKGAAKYYLDEGYYKQAQNCYVQAVGSNPRLLPEVLLDYEGKITSEANNCWQPEKIGPRLSLAGFLLVADALDPAILELEEILEDNPQSVEAYNALGRIYIKQERIDDAIALLERSIARGVKDVNLTETLATAYLERGRVGEAVKFYEEILTQRPGDKQTLRILGELYTRLEEYNQAARKYAAMFSDDPEVVREVIQRLEELLRRVEGNIEIREILADIYMKTLDPDSAVSKLREILCLESTKLEETIQKLKSILKSYPNHPAAMLALAEALRRQGNFSEAAENYQQLIKVKPEFIEEVIRGYREVIEVCPEQVLARAYLGEALLTQGKIPEALSEFGKMIESDPTVAETVVRKCREILRQQPQLLSAHIVLGQAYLAKGDYQRAAVEAEGAIALDKDLTPAYLLLGEAYVNLNLLRKAAQALHTALALEPFNLQVHEKYRRVREKEIDLEIETSKDHFDLVKLYLEKGARDEAVRELQLGQKDTARAPLALNLLGDIYRSEGRFDLAAAQYNHALELATPEHSKIIRFNLGTTYEAQGQVRKAIKIYEGILQEDIDFGNLKKRIRDLKATSLLGMRNLPLEAAIHEYGKKGIIALWGRDLRAGAHPGRKEEVNVSFGQEHNSEGFEFFMKGMFPAAEEEFSLAVQLDRRFGAALNNFAVTLAKQGKFEEARLRLNEAVQIDPASAVFYNNLGVIYLLLGKIDLASTALEKSFALDPESSAVCLNLGDVHYCKKAVPKAIEFYRRVGTFDPLSSLARKRLMYKMP